MIGLLGRTVATCCLLINITTWAQESSGASGKTGQARVVVYREGRYKNSAVKPPIYFDDQQVAYLYSGRYFTITLTPGKHRLTSNDEETAVTLDAQPGATHYVRVGQSKSWRWGVHFSVEQVDQVQASQALKKMKPADAKHVTKPSLVSTAAEPLR